MYRSRSQIAQRTLAAAVGAILGSAMAASSAQGLGADPAPGHHHMLHHAADAEPVALHDHGAMHPTAGDQAATGHDHGAMQHDAHEHDGHESHARMLSQPGYARTEAVYRVPDVVLTNQKGERVKLRELLSGPQPVMLNYIYTSCTAICPVLSASFAQTQKALGKEARDVRMVSISIDPEYDNPARLRDYAQRFDVGVGWELLTGSLADIVAVQKAFEAYRGNKASHIPLTFIRAGAGDRWIRLQGFASAGELVQEYRSLASSSASSAAGAGRG